MTTVTLNEREVEVPDSWFDVSWKKFIAFSKLVKTQPSEEELNEKYKDEDSDIKALQISLANVEFNTKIACFWTGLTDEEIALCPLDEVEGVMKTMEFLNEQYHPISLDTFTFKDVKYVLPKPGMRGENFGTYIEAEQIEINNRKLKKGQLEILPKQLAILVREEGQEPGLIDDDDVERKAKIFEDLDMATIWDVAFFLFRQETSLMSSFLTYLRMEETQKQDLLQKGQ